MGHPIRGDFECTGCLLRQAHEAIALATSDAGLRETAMRQTLRFLDHLDWSASPPLLAQKLHAFIRQAVGDPDPYADVKALMNRRALDLFSVWHPRFHHAFSPLEAAVRLSIVGNLLDLGAKTLLSESATLAAFEQALSAPVLGSVEALARAVRNASRILYLADNAGEIVFDRDLLAQLPLGGFTVAVRGGPILNDATLADAEETGVTALGDVMTNGSDAPGTLLEDCSTAFLTRFAEADLVIAKGQGNYESLKGVAKPVFHLLMVKCDVVARALRCPRGSLVLHTHKTKAGPCR